MTTDQPHTNISHPPYDPALADHLAELEEICQEIGATDIQVLRSADMTWLYYETNGRVGEMRIPESGVIFIARFSTTDGGEPGLEQP